MMAKKHFEVGDEISGIVQDERVIGVETDTETEQPQVEQPAVADVVSDAPARVVDVPDFELKQLVIKLIGRLTGAGQVSATRLAEAMSAADYEQLLVGDARQSRATLQGIRDRIADAKLAAKQ